MKRLWILPFCLIALLALYLLPINSHADGEYVGFSVRALLPDNQLDRGHSYFDLRVQPNGQQSLRTEIMNAEQEEITVKLSVRNASTNQNGMIIYEKQEGNLEDDIIYLSDIARFEEDEVVIPAGESKIVSANLELPDEAFDGVILGGLHFEKVPEDDKEETEGVAIENKYAYLIGVLLSQNDRYIRPELDFIDVKADLVNHRTANVITLVNNTPVLIEDLEIQAKIYKEKERTPLKEKQQAGINMAPHSKMEYVVEWDNERIEAGTYRVEVEAVHATESLVWQDTFTVLKEEAKEINELAVEIEEPTTLNTIMMASGITLIAIIVGLLIYIRKLKQE